jgi:hypothetical protein
MLLRIVNEEVFGRGDIIVFSWNRSNSSESRCGPHVKKFIHASILGVVLSSQKYHITRREQVNERTLLTVLTVGEFNSKAICCPDHITERFHGRNLSSRFVRTNDILSDLDIICIQNILNYHQQKKRSAPMKIFVTEDVCTRPSQIRSKLESALKKLKSIQVILRLWLSWTQWKTHCYTVYSIKSTSAICLQKYARRYLNKNRLQKMISYKKWWNLHKEFPYIPIGTTLWTKSYCVDGTHVFLPTKHMSNKWASFMKSKMLLITTVAMRSVEHRVRHLWLRWRIAIKKQDDELRLMRAEEYYSHVNSKSTEIMSERV